AGRPPPGRRAVARPTGRSRAPRRPIHQPRQPRGRHRHAASRRPGLAAGPRRGPRRHRADLRDRRVVRPLPGAVRVRRRPAQRRAPLRRARDPAEPGHERVGRPAVAGVRAAVPARHRLRGARGGQPAGRLPVPELLAAPDRRDRPGAARRSAAAVPRVRHVGVLAVRDHRARAALRRHLVHLAGLDDLGGLAQPRRAPGRPDQGPDPARSLAPRAPDRRRGHQVGVRPARSRQPGADRPGRHPPEGGV
ncbi:MAG: hypothetical protein AVDCRST_MAG66-375, partial [uncultured Pseudonocardia sp.]